MPDRTATPKRRLTRDDWITAALAAIADRGLAGVAVEPLATTLGTTKGSFYWHFPNREALLQAALEAWERDTTTAVLALVDRAPAGPHAQLRLLIRLVVEIVEHDPVDLALIAHASHPVVGPAVERVTRARIDGTARLFARLGFRSTQARHRALLAYSAYLGHAQLSHSTPGLLPQGRTARRAYLEHALAVLASPPARPAG